MSRPPRRGGGSSQPPEPPIEPPSDPPSQPPPMIDPHDDEDVIRDVPELSVDEVEKRIGAKQRVRQRRIAMATPARIRTAPSNRRAILWRDSATILIFVVIALLAARFLLPGQDGLVNGSPTPQTSGIAISSGPLDTGFNFTPIPTVGPPVDASNGINATPTPIPVITLGPPPTPRPTPTPTHKPGTTPHPTPPPTAPPTAPPPPPVAAFSCAATATVHEESFTDTSTNAVSWSWNLGDSSTDVTQNPPNHPYANAGPWTVTLTVTSASAATDSISHSCAPLGDPPVASFTCSTGAANVVNFTDTSTGTISSGTWDWADSTTSAWAGSTSHDYTSTGGAGLYHVTLTLTGPDGSSGPYAQDCTAAP